VNKSVAKALYKLAVEEAQAEWEIKPRYKLHKKNYKAAQVEMKSSRNGIKVLTEMLKQKGEKNES
jgi:NOL1/NOP2/fmu family ribosome biogenesis protein